MGQRKKIILLCFDENKVPPSPLSDLVFPLRNNGYEIHQVSTPEEALAIVKSGVPLNLLITEKGNKELVSQAQEIRGDLSTMVVSNTAPAPDEAHAPIFLLKSRDNSAFMAQISILCPDKPVRKRDHSKNQKPRKPSLS